MEKYIARVSYWLGVVSVAVSLIWRAANALGIGGGVHSMARGATIDYMSFFKGAVLFLLVAIASGGYTSLSSQKP